MQNRSFFGVSEKLTQELKTDIPCLMPSFGKA